MVENVSTPERGVKRGSRGLSNNYTEPSLLKDAEDILAKAKEGGYYKGESLDLESLISTIDDIKVEYDDNMIGGVSGSLYHHKGVWIISINSKHHLKRQRFTLAHELGHYILHKDKNSTFEDTTFFRGAKSDAIEYSANTFAATILMPEKSVRALLNEGINSVSKLAERFNVSVSAMKYRLMGLGYRIN